MYKYVKNRIYYRRCAMKDGLRSWNGIGNALYVRSCKHPSLVLASLISTNAGEGLPYICLVRVEGAFIARTWEEQLTEWSKSYLLTYLILCHETIYNLSPTHLIPYFVIVPELSDVSNCHTLFYPRTFD